MVSVGDCPGILTAGCLKSCLHRVVPMLGQEMMESYSFAYLMRPEDRTWMRPVVQSPFD